MHHYPNPFDIQNPDGRFPAIFCVEHARNYIPPELNALGVSEADLQTHIAWDIGIEGVTRRLSDELDVPSIYGLYSRLIIDLNRPLDHPELIWQVSDGVEIPGNQNLGEAERAARIEQIYEPYHAALGKMLRHEPVVIGMHSCTPQLRGEAPRPWQIGLSTYESEEEMAQLASVLRKTGLNVGIHEPYDTRELTGSSLDRHGRANGLPHILIEIRQDLIADQAGQTRWCDILARAFITLE